jgi:hypothetical protein
MERDVYEHTFVVRNTGSSLLVIDNVRSGSGAGRWTFDREIEAGGEGRIHYRLEGAKVHGRFSKTLIIRSNDPVQPEVWVALAGEEIPYITIKPRQRIYLKAHFRQSLHRETRLVAHDRDPGFRVTGITSNNDDLIDYSFQESETPGEWIVRVEKVPAPSTGNYFVSLEIGTNHPRAPVRTLLVHVVNEGDFQVTPRTARFHVRRDSSRSVTKRTLRLSTREAKLEVTDITVDNERFSASYEVAEPGMAYDLLVTYHPGPTAVRHEFGTLKIHTTYSQESTIEVRLHGSNDGGR